MDVEKMKAAIEGARKDGAMAVLPSFSEPYNVRSGCRCSELE